MTIQFTRQFDAFAETATCRVADMVGDRPGTVGRRLRALGAASDPPLCPVLVEEGLGAWIAALATDQAAGQAQ